MKPRIRPASQHFNPKTITARIPIGMAAVIVEYLGHELAVVDDLIEDDALVGPYRTLLAETIASIQEAIEKGALK